MAKTKRDEELHRKIKLLTQTLIEKNKKDNEIIDIISGTCNISHRTASEQFRAARAQKTFEELGIDLKKCKNHEWSNWFSSPGGLARECRVCHHTEFFKQEEKTAQIGSLSEIEE